MTTMKELREQPVIDISAAVSKLFEASMELLEGTRRLMEDQPTISHQQWEYSEQFRTKEAYFDMTNEEQEKLGEAIQESYRRFPDRVVGTGGDDTWFDYHPCNLSAVQSIIELSLKVIGTDEWAGPPKPDVARPLIKPLLQEWAKNADINDPASEVAEIVPYLTEWLDSYGIDRTDTGSLSPEYDEDYQEDTD